MDESVNIQALIDSGDLELYVLGTLEEADMERITRLSKAHPELMAEIESIEAGLMAMSESVTDHVPDQRLLDQVLSKLDEGDSETSDQEAAVVPLAKPSAGFQPRWAWAAAVLLLIGSVVLNIMFYGNMEESEQKLLALQQENIEIAQNFDQASFDLQEQAEQLAALQSEGIQRVQLGAVDETESYQATVFWEPELDLVYLTETSLPEAPSGFQYQLWAIIDGQPVDAGLLTTLTDSQKMKSVSGAAAAFAITLEPEGGSETPTLDQMVVVGTV